MRTGPSWVVRAEEENCICAGKAEEGFTKGRISGRSYGESDWRGVPVCRCCSPGWGACIYPTGNRELNVEPLLVFSEQEREKERERASKRGWVLTTLIFLSCGQVTLLEKLQWMLSALTESRLQIIRRQSQPHVLTVSAGPGTGLTPLQARPEREWKARGADTGLQLTLNWFQCWYPEPGTVLCHPKVKFKSSG